MKRNEAAGKKALVELNRNVIDCIESAMKLLKALGREPNLVSVLGTIVTQVHEQLTHIAEVQSEDED